MRVDRSTGVGRAAKSALLVCVLAAASVGCRYPATEVLVTVDTDAPAERTLTINVAVVGGGAMTTQGAAAFMRGPLDGGIQLPGSFAVTPTGSSDQPVTMNIDVQVAGDADHPPIAFRRIARFMFIRRATTAVPVFLAVNCGNPTTGCTQTDAAHCTVSALCEEQHQTCGDDGRCVAQDVTPVPSDGGLTLPVLETGRRDEGPPVMDVVDVSTDAVPDARDVSLTIDAPMATCDANVGLSDPRNCGACGMICPVACSAGHCVTVASVQGSRSATCAVMSDARVRCWGSNAGTVLGIRGRSEYLTPTEVPGLTNIVQIGIGSDHGCALTNAHSVLCWGSNSAGALGDGTTNARATIAPVPGLVDAVEIAVGGRHTCARRMDGSVVCWGASEAGQTGPTSMTTCVVRASDADAGRVSNTIRCATRPTTVPNVVGATQIVAGGNHTCTLGGGTVRCWGNNDQRQLGFPTGSTCYQVSMQDDAGMGPAIACSADALSVPGFSGATSIAAGGLHTCATLSDNTTWCWGHDDDGQLGDGLLTDRTMAMAVLSAPRTAFVLPGAIASGGFDHTAILGTAGTVYTFGNGSDGQLGNGTTSGSLTPFLVPGMADVAAVALGSFHTCVRTRTGALRCWGQNASGQLGNGLSGIGVRGLTPIAPLW